VLTFRIFFINKYIEKYIKIIKIYQEYKTKVVNFENSLLILFLDFQINKVVSHFSELKSQKKLVFFSLEEAVYLRRGWLAIPMNCLKLDCDKEKKFIWNSCYCFEVDYYDFHYFVSDFDANYFIKFLSDLVNLSIQSIQWTFEPCFPLFCSS